MKYKDYEGTIEELIAWKLREIEEKENVVILHAVESGSRAWGFASPDSDYDVRFIYVRPIEYYLQLEQKKDTIEWALDEVLDINGWDLSKVLRHFHKSNAVMFEWANSPVVYKTTELWREIVQGAAEYFSEKAAVYHYYGTAKKNCELFLRGENVRYKKYFYVLRPLLACQWIEQRHCPPPVLFSEMAESILENRMKSFVSHLLELKTKMTEAETAAHIPEIDEYIDNALIYYKSCADSLPDDRNPDWKHLNQLFLNAIKP